MIYRILREKIMKNNELKLARKNKIGGKKSSVDCSNHRFLVAEREVQKNHILISRVLELIEQALVNIELETHAYIHSMNVKPNYDKIREENNLNHRRHIVWLKFTTDGFLGCVAASDDINFGDNNTSGKIIRHLNKEWDKTFVVIIPLPSIKNSERSDIEAYIGNYLIDNGVPILDFYSHTF